LTTSAQAPRQIEEEVLSVGQSLSQASFVGRVQGWRHCKQASRMFSQEATATERCVVRLHSIGKPAGGRKC
jgi:hypothetical protein